MTASAAAFNPPNPGLEEPTTYSQLSKVVSLSDATASLLESLRRIEKLKALQPNWDSYGSPPVQPAAAQAAVQVLYAAQADYCPPPRIVPVPGGGLQIEWARGSRELEIEMLPDGSIEFLRVEGSQTFEEPLPVNRIYSFVPNLVRWLTETKGYAAAL